MRRKKASEVNWFVDSGIEKMNPDSAVAGDGRAEAMITLLTSKYA